MKRKPAFVFISAITGRFVTAAYARRYPHLTIRRRVKQRKCERNH